MLTIWSAACIRAFGWLLGMSSVVNFMSGMTMGLIALNKETYQVQRWHVWLLSSVIAWAAVAINVFFSRHIPVFNKLMCRCY